MSEEVTQPTVLAIDPGTDKCGVAVLNANYQVLYRAVVPLAQLAETVAALVSDLAVSYVGVGDRTGSSRVHELLAEACPDVDLHRICEDMTSRLARRRFWTENPARGLQRLVPLGLRVPPGTIDDYAATILAERLLADRVVSQGFRSGGCDHKRTEYHSPDSS